MRTDRQRCEKCGRFVSVLDDLPDHYAESCPVAE